MEILDAKQLFNHIIGNIITGAFARDEKGNITGLNPKLEKRLKPAFRGWSSADETILGQVLARLDASGERTIYRRWISKMRKAHWSRQLRLHIVNIYHEAGLEAAVEVLKSYLAIQQDDDDSIKTELLLKNGIFTEDDPVEQVKDFVKKEFNDTRDALLETGDDLAKTNSGLASYLARIKR